MIITSDRNVEQKGALIQVQFQVKWSAIEYSSLIQGFECKNVKCAAMMGRRLSSPRFFFSHTGFTLQTLLASGGEGKSQLQLRALRGWNGDGTECLGMQSCCLLAFTADKYDWNGLSERASDVLFNLQCSLDKSLLMTGFITAGSLARSRRRGSRSAFYHFFGETLHTHHTGL